MMTITISVALLGASIAYANIHQGRAVNAGLPPQSVLVDPKSFAVLPDDFSYRTDSFNQHFNPTNSQDFPTFQVFNGAFLDIIGSSPSISEIASNSSFAFAHEAPDHWAEQMLSSGGSQTVNVPITQIPLPDSIQMTNGATGPSNGNLILANSGRGTIPSTIALVNSKPPHNATFTRQVEIFSLRIPSMASLTDSCSDGKTAYIADTGASGGKPTEPGTVYAFDVDPTTETFLNRRILAYIDAGVPDGLQVDVNGNVYTACADGVQVFDADGTLLGKFFLDISSANMVFAGPGRMVILAETKVFLAKIAPTTKGVVS
ncbi:hypothetical protein Agabi119p4_10920 [Agaricus bisporus var. burnettii]|uniref:SMP-30/Gluconolactonase/LRE-like region domain-containing protein n=1 Tax=Agaricus bisporus var. burnettii TaxID=192524 RepID=A0A8H7BZG4_AGABI|nr:hypothetical protein Agabi119p4_10920 [Agaricus bisporus var. burnettii]